MPPPATCRLPTRTDRPKSVPKAPAAHRHAESERHALVIGAGLAGAAVCAVLARSGWRLTLVDAAHGPAQAASSLPVGMLSPHVTRAPTPLSRLSLLGVADTRAELERLVPQGHGWQACEVDNLGHDAGRWPAALVRPAALVNAWLDEAGRLVPLTTRWNQSVAQLRESSADAAAPSFWTALGPDGSSIAQAPVVVVCAAFGSLSILSGEGAGLLPPDALPLRPVKGQMSLAELTGEPLADRPQRDNGVHVPCYEDVGLAPEWPTRIWAMGSTYVRGDAGTEVTDAEHERNAHSLLAMNPMACARFREAAQANRLLGWAQARCASLDRLPLAGAVPDTSALLPMMRLANRRARPGLSDVPRLPGLYMLGALGSRGITLAHWCAKALAARIHGLPFEEGPPDLLAAIDPARFAWKQARRG